MRWLLSKWNDWLLLGFRPHYYYYFFNHLPRCAFAFKFHWNATRQLGFFFAVRLVLCTCSSNLFTEHLVFLLPHQQAPMFKRNVLYDNGASVDSSLSFNMLVFFFTCWYFLISFRERMALNSSLFWLDLRRSCSVIHRWKIPMQLTHTNRTALATSWNRRHKKRKVTVNLLMWQAWTDYLLPIGKYIHVTCFCVLQHTFLSEEIICVPA